MTATLVTSLAGTHLRNAGNIYTITGKHPAPRTCALLAIAAALDTNVLGVVDGTYAKTSPGNNGLVDIGLGRRYTITVNQNGVTVIPYSRREACYEFTHTAVTKELKSGFIPT